MDNNVTANSVKPRPRILEGATYQIKCPVGTAYVTINNNGDGLPFEVFVTVGKAGSAVMADAEMAGRLISLLLRTAIDSKKISAEIIDQLQRIGGGQSVGLGSNRVTSLADAIAKALSEHLGLDSDLALSSSKETAAVSQALSDGRIGDLCPECGHASLIREEGCQKCLDCGYSKC